MASTKTVTGKVTGFDGTNKGAAAVVITPSQACYIAGTQEVVPSRVMPTVAADGSWSAQLYANNDLTPNGTYYTVQMASLDGGYQILTIQVPQTAGPFEVANLVTSTPTASPTPNHVSTLTVDAAATFTAGPISAPAGSIPLSAVSGAAPTASPTFTGGVTISSGGLNVPAGVIAIGPGGVLNNPRLPFQGGSTIDSATLGSTPVSSKVGYQLNTFFRGNFANEVTWGQTNPGFVFGVDIFPVTGSAVGDIASITDFYGAVVEPHIYSPSTALTNLYGLQTQATYDTGSAGTITNIFGLRATRVGKNGTSTLTAQNLYNVWIDDIPTDGAAVNWSLYDLGNAFIGKQTKLVAGINTTLAAGNADAQLLGVGNPNNTIVSYTAAPAQARPYLFVHPALTSTPAITIPKAATLTVDDAPGFTGGVTITNRYALWVQAGTTELDGGATILGNTPNVQGSAAGTYLGNQALEMADGANTFRIDLNAATLRILKAGVASLWTLDLNGNMTVTGATRINGNVGFYNTAPVAKQTVTGSKGANAALTSLMTALAALGLVTDSTT